MTDAPSDPAPVLPRKRRFGCGSMILVFLLLLLATGGVLIWLALSEPAGWKQVGELVEAVPHGERAALGESLQIQFNNALQGRKSADALSVPPGTNVAEELNRFHETTLSIPVKEANLWLMTQLPALLENQKTAMPKGISEPRVWIEDGQVVLSCRVELAGISGIASFGLDMNIQEDGKMALKIARVSTGKLRVPSAAVASAVQDELKKASNEAVRRIGDAFDGTTFDPVFNDPGNPDQRETRITGLQVHPDRLDLKLRNGPKGKK